MQNLADEWLRINRSRPVLAFSKRNNKFPATQPYTNAFQQIAATKLQIS